MRFEFDPEKAAENLRKHKVSLADSFVELPRFRGQFSVLVL